VNGGKLAIRKGYVLSEEDMAFKKYILDIACKGAALFDEDHLPLLQTYTFPKLEALAADGLVEWNTTGLRLTEQGHYFIRVVCSAFDLYLQRGVQSEKPIFSKAI
jgi:oxygen-independent coproporphyrinogen-3 oxidase